MSGDEPGMRRHRGPELSLSATTCPLTFPGQIPTGPYSQPHSTITAPIRKKTVIISALQIFQQFSSQMETNNNLALLKNYWLSSYVIPNRGQQTFSGKAQIVNNLGFEGHMVSVTTTTLLLQRESSHIQTIHKRLGSIKLYLQKQFGGWI